VRILFSGDWQLQVSNLDRAQTVVDLICKTLTPKDYFVHLGDIKEDTNPVDQRVTNFIVRAWEQICSSCAGTYYVRGNHDSITTQDGTPSICTLIEALGAITVADTEWKLCETAGISMYLVPYFRDQARQRKAFQDAAKHANQTRRTARTVLVFHNEVEGCQRTAYTKGVGLKLDDLYVDYYNLVVAGHIHRPQQFQEVIYAGSPFCMDWGECNEEKSLFVATFARNEVSAERIPTGIPGWYDPSVPGYIRPASFKDTHYRFRVPITVDPVKEMSEVRQRLEERYPGTILHLIPEFQSSAAPDTVDLTGGDNALVKQYVEKLTLPEHVTVEQVTDYLGQYLSDAGMFGVQGLQFQAVRAENVLCFDKVHMELDQKGLTLVTGRNLDWKDGISNGSGKSSLVSLPFLALFGRTFKDQVDDGWACQNNEDPAKVELFAGLPDGRQLRIYRQRRPGLLQVFVDDKEVSMGDKHASQRMIEGLTNLTWDVLTNSVYIGQREIGSLFGTEKERKELFNHLLGLSRYSTVNDKLRKIALKRQLAVMEVESDVTTTEAALQEAGKGTADIEDALKQAPQIDPADIKKAEYRISELEAQIRQYESDNAVLDPQLDANQKRFEQYLFKQADADGKILGLQEQIQASSSVEGQCALCGGKVSVAVVEKYIHDLQMKVQKLEVFSKTQGDFMKKNRTIRRALMEKYSANNIAREKDLREVSLVKQAHVKLREMLEARTRLERLLATKQQRRAVLERELAIHKLAHTACMEEKQFVDICIAVTGRDGLPTYLCEVAAPQLNTAATRYSQCFTDGEVGLQFEISGGDIDVEICNLHGGEYLKDQSAGEMRMVSLVAALAFRDVLVRHNILVLDEPSEGLDAANSAAFARGLNTVVDRFTHVIVITHSPYILANLEPDHRIEVTKQNRTSAVKTV
jgi:DNA repair exonuclease SbcCD ATPase subunit/DNA repair exonuclease SbcCD nuclease subunit